jgi:plasma kallikrein
MINSRFSNVDERNECHYLEVCCDPENIISENEGQSVILKQIHSEIEDQCIQTCKAMPQDRIKPAPMIQYIESCGYRNKNGVGLQITNSSDITQFGEFPWMVALSEFREFGDFHYICGGSLIHPSVVLTGAHCVYAKEAKNLMARLGEWDTRTLFEPFPHVDHKVEKIITHENFGPTNLHNNIALLVLETPVVLKSHINTICIPPQNSRISEQKCIATGWGADNFDKKEVYRVNLKKLELPTVPLKECQDRLRTTVLGNLFKLDMSFMCAGGEKDVDTCVGEFIFDLIKKKINS